jgi:hypothetical protein
MAPSPPRFSGGEGRGEVVLIKTFALPHVRLHSFALPLAAAPPRWVPSWTIPRFAYWNLIILWCLDVGAWSFSHPCLSVSIRG